MSGFTLVDLVQASLSTWFLTDIRWWVLVLCLSVPHWLYAFVWTRSKAFERFVFEYIGIVSPVTVFSTTAHCLKVWQFLSLSAWYLGKGPFLGLGDRSVPQLVIALGLLAFGQLLNISMMKAIGTNGVYYGVRLHRPVPWCTDFPFNTFRHPQYLGSVASLWGILLLIATPQHAAAGIFQVGVMHSAMYAITGYIEDHF